MATGMANRARWIHVALACSALTAVTANADEIGVYGLLGAYQTDNGLQTSDRRRQDTVGWFSFGTYGKWESGRFRTSWTLSEDGVKYFNGSFGAKAYTSGSLKIDYNALPDFMTWRLQDNTGQILVTPSQPDTPLNRANFNVFSTGPAFHVPVTRTTWVGADALYSNTYYEKQTLNGDKVDLDLGFNKNLGHKTDVGVYVGQTEGTYKAFGRFKTENASLRFTGAGAFTKIKAEAGVNRAVMPFRTGALPSFDIDIERKFRDTSSFAMKLRRKITNPSETFAQIAGTGYGPGSFYGGVSAADLPNTLGLFDSRLARVGYETLRRRNEVKLGLYYRREDTLPGAVFVEHRRIKGIDGMYHRIWGSKVGIILYGSYEKHNGELAGFHGYQEMVVGTEIARPIWTVATRWVITLEHRRRTGEDTFNNYREYRIGAYLRFSKFIFNRVD